MVLWRKQDACLQVLPRGIARLDAVRLAGEQLRQRRFHALAAGDTTTDVTPR